MSAAKLTAGSVALAAAVRLSTSTAVAEKTGCSQKAIDFYSKGERMPSGPVRGRFWRELGIDPEAWVSPPGTTQASAPPPAGPPSLPEESSLGFDLTGDGSTEEKVSALMAEVVRNLQEARSNKLAPMSHRTALINQARGVLQLWARVRGELEVSDAQLIRSPAWTRAFGIIMRAAEPYPDACLAIANALAGLEGES